MIEILIDDNLMKSIVTEEWDSSDGVDEFDRSLDISDNENKDLEEVKLSKLKQSKMVNIGKLAKKARFAAMTKDKAILANADSKKRKSMF